jgi:hypothetical protein
MQLRPSTPHAFAYWLCPYCKHQQEPSAEEMAAASRDYIAGLGEYQGFKPLGRSAAQSAVAVEDVAAELGVRISSPVTDAELQQIRAAFARNYSGPAEWRPILLTKEDVARAFGVPVESVLTQADLDRSARAISSKPNGLSIAEALLDAIDIIDQCAAIDHEGVRVQRIRDAYDQWIAGAPQASPQSQFADTIEATNKLTVSIEGLQATIDQGCRAIAAALLAPDPITAAMDEATGGGDQLRTMDDPPLADYQSGPG